MYIYISGKIASNFGWMFITSMFRVSTHQINKQVTIGANPIITMSKRKENQGSFDRGEQEGRLVPAGGKELVLHIEGAEARLLHEQMFFG